MQPVGGVGKRRNPDEIGRLPTDVRYAAAGRLERDETRGLSIGVIEYAGAFDGSQIA